MGVSAANSVSIPYLMRILRLQESKNVSADEER
jgi:hypothetical protein